MICDVVIMKMKYTMPILAAVLLLYGCRRPATTPDRADRALRERIIGTWVIDTARTVPGRKAMLEAHGLPPSVVQSRMQQLAEIDKSTRAVISADTLTVSELGGTQELKYIWTGPDTIRFPAGDTETTARIVCPDGEILQFADCSMSHMIWRREPESQQTPGTYSSKAADGLTGNAQE